MISIFLQHVGNNISIKQTYKTITYTFTIMAETDNIKT